MSGATLVAALRRLGYERVHQRGSHVRVTTSEGGEHHEVVPLHDPIRAKTLSSIPKSVARHHGMGLEELLRKLDLRYREDRLHAWLLARASPSRRPCLGLGAEPPLAP